MSNKLLINDETLLFREVAGYMPEHLLEVKRAYDFAKNAHAGQVRKSGEEYIIHPLNVAYTLALYRLDAPTIIAGILHDVLEDTKVSKEKLTILFGEEVASLVEGVTNLEEVDFATKEELDMANMRKVILGLLQDIRIVLIKFADRLHNMRTLEYKSEIKRVLKAKETLAFYAPLAFFLGLHPLKGELEDLSLKFISPEDYATTLECQKEIMHETADLLTQMMYNIQNALIKKNIEANISPNVKHVYGIYKKLKRGHMLYDIHDLLSLRIITGDITDCYRTLGTIHGIYHPVNSRFKDFIASPKTNMYRSVHTTVFAPNDFFVQMRIKTEEMNFVNQRGITSFQGNIGHGTMQEIASNYQFFDIVRELNDTYEDNADFLSHIKAELFEDKVYIFSQNGQVIEMPKGSTPLDFAYYCSKEIGDRAIMTLVNGQNVPFDYELQNNDCVQVVLGSKYAYRPPEESELLVRTTKARKRILEKETKK